MSDLQDAFVHDSLLPRVVSPDAPGAVNLLDEYRRYIQQTGMSEIEATEKADRQIHGVRRSLDRYLEDWEAQGVPRPIVADTEQEHIFVVWPHAEFERFSGRDEGIDRNFCEIYRYLQGMDGRRFLIVCALWLKCLGFGTTFICDGRQDEGVDLLARLEKGGLRALSVVVQSKTSKGRLGRGTVVSEYCKFLALPNSGKNRTYRELLRVESSRDGAALVYLLLTNSEFDAAAQDAARKLGFLVRSNAQLSFVIGKRCSKEQVEQEVNRLQGRIGVDLGTNFAQLIRI